MISNLSKDLIGLNTQHAFMSQARRIEIKMQLVPREYRHTTSGRSLRWVPLKDIITSSSQRPDWGVYSKSGRQVCMCIVAGRRAVSHKCPFTHHPERQRLNCLHERSWNMFVLTWTWALPSSMQQYDHQDVGQVLPSRARARHGNPVSTYPFPAHYACEEVLAFCGFVYVYVVSQQWRLPMCDPESDYLHEWRCWKPSHAGYRLCLSL